MSWNYAELSKAAKAAGGPEKLIKSIRTASETAGRMKGRSEMLPWMGVAALSGVALKSVYDYFKEKRAIAVEEADIAEQELVEGIKAYDAEHQEDENVVEASDVTEADEEKEEDVDAEASFNLEQGEEENFEEAENNEDESKDDIQEEQ